MDSHASISSSPVPPMLVSDPVASGLAVHAAEYQRSIDDPSGFWAEQALAIDWFTAPKIVLDDSGAPFVHWFPDGVMNTCFNAVDRHVQAGHGDRIALIHDSPVTGTVTRFTYAELLNQVQQAAGMLAALGVGKGDRVVLYLPMIPEALISMLACARIGAVHSVVFGGFAPAELAVRIDDALPKVLVTASCGIEGAKVLPYLPMVTRALELSKHTPTAVVLVTRPQVSADLLPGGDVDWEQACAAAHPFTECEPMAATDPLYVLYTSGTTGKPKGVVRDNGGHAVALAYSMRAVYDIGAGDVWWAASDVGWVVGHSYIVYAPLLAGATTVLFEGKPVGTPDAGTFWRVIAEHGVKAMFTAPTAIRAIKKEDPDGLLRAGHDLSSLATLFLAGERLDPGTYKWATDALGIPVVDNWWQTETGWPIAANLRGLSSLGSALPGAPMPVPLKAGSPSLPVPGFNIEVVDEHGELVPPGTDGNIVLRLPLPPGCLPTLWNDDERFVSSYLSTFAGCYTTGDGGMFDADGYLFVMGRTDDVINVAGHRLSTGAMEAVVASHPAVAECAVIGVADSLKGQVPRGFVVLKSGSMIDHEVLRAELVAMMRDEIGPVASFRDVAVVAGLPKTRSGKILRRTMRGIADGRDEPVPSTIEDACVLDLLRPVLQQRS